MGNTSLASPNKLSLLQDRAHMLGLARQFFALRGIMEVDCPLIAKAACIDQHIDLMEVHTFSGIRYLHSSPEYFMKRLLAIGSGDIYQLAHVFRDAEHSSKHNPEFMMAEWYRTGFAFGAMIEETLDFITLFLGEQKVEHLTYEEAFLRHVGINPLTASDQELLDCLSISPYSKERDDLLNLLLATHIEPNLQGLVVLKHFPASQAALAKKERGIALRFEIYCKGIELCNGYQELIDAKEQRLRLEEANKCREKKLPLDEAFLQALEKGLPECCGVAVGFDRLMMLRHELSSLPLPFLWEEA